MINYFIAAVSSFTVDFISRTGYGGLFILSFLESAAIPIPSEIVIPFSGYLAALGRFSLVAVVLFSSIGNLAGSLTLYLIGRSGGRYLLERFGKYFFIRHKELVEGDHWFNHYGKRAVFFGRILPGIRTFISLAPGVTRMNVLQFSIYTFLGALPWNLALAVVGYKAGQNWAVLHKYFQKLDIIILVAIITAIIWYIFKHSRRNE